MTGHHVDESLAMKEKGGRSPLVYNFEFLDKNTFRLTKAFAKGHREPFVIETFRRQ